MRLLGIACAVVLAACSESPAPPPPEAPEEAAEAPVVATERSVYFGDLHVHTSWSTDAYAGGNRVGPDNAYRFARGEAIELPNGVTVQLDQPLDFVALTDHAEGFDAIAACTYEDHPHYSSEACQNMRSPRPNLSMDYLRGAFERGVARPPLRNLAFCPDGEEQCIANSKSTWQRVQAVANEFDDPGNFTTLIAYEFSSLLPEFGMLHRNVVFRGSDVIPHALSSFDVMGQADFLRKLDTACEAPCEVLTIPHNTNYSWGLAFRRTDEDGSAYTAEDLERRARLDRLVEITQLKGTSECQMGVGAADEDCDFGILFPACEEGQTGRCAAETSFVRNALLDGIRWADEGSVNPFQLGIVAATDTHNSDPANNDGENPGRYGTVRGNELPVQATLNNVHPVIGPIRRTNEGGLAAVWADSNTRSDIFDALQRREAFGTTGSRIRLRFFAGDYPADFESSAASPYGLGDPMGSALEAGDARNFWVAAQQDPAGSSLDRIQVVKGWVDTEGNTHSRVWDVACAGGRVPDDSGQCARTTVEVDPETCAVGAGTAAGELQTVFRDPEFDPNMRSFYYVRVLENPTCRWTTWLANSAGIVPPSDVAPVAQQRAWSSPIWFEPGL